MTRMLASVNSLEEAMLINTLKVDLIDLKQPAEGALGALDVHLVQQIVKAVDGQKPISATVGDLPMQAEVIFNAVSAMASTGVDYIKIGFFPADNWQEIIEKLSQIAHHQALIAVLFADAQPDLSIIPQLHQAGFAGVMLDTMNKQRGSLTSLMTTDKLTRFVKAGQHDTLLTGLAGSLSQSDMVDLLPLDADYLGFRGALCKHHNRVAQLDKKRIMDIIQSFRG